MGLLDSILGGIAGNALGRARGLGGMRGFGGRGGRSSVLMALLPVVLSMLAKNRAGARISGSALPGPGLGPADRSLGGLGGLGGIAGMGGLGGLLERFQQKGYADQVQSWIGTGENQPLPPEALSQVFDGDQLSQIATHAGVSEDEARTGLTELLPQVVDHLTPQGQLPESDQLLSSIDEVERHLHERA